MADQELSGDTEESEDLFNFAELYATPEKAAAPTLVEAAEGNLPDVDSEDSPRETAPVFDESDCLFNFDELQVEADLEVVDAAQVLADVPEASEAPSSESEQAEDGEAKAMPSVASPIPDHAPTQAVKTASAAQVPLTPPTAAPAPAPVAALSVDHQAAELSRFPALQLSVRSPLLWILIASISLNLAVIGFTWRVSGTVSDEIERATLSIIQASQGTQDPQRREEASSGETGSGDLQPTASPVVVTDSEYEYTFVRASKEIESGEYSSARKRLYALLAITDRLAPDVRERIEATAQYMLADASMKVAMTSAEVVQ